jgi:uncharacterized protein YpmS
MNTVENKWPVWKVCYFALMALLVVGGTLVVASVVLTAPWF